MENRQIHTRMNLHSQSAYLMEQSNCDALLPVLIQIKEWIFPLKQEISHIRDSKLNVKSMNQLNRELNQR